jgi:hypothetical protein
VIQDIKTLGVKNWRNLVIEKESWQKLVRKAQDPRWAAEPKMMKKAWVCGLLVAGIAGSNPVEACMFVSCVYVVLSCVDRGLCDGLITVPEKSCRASNFGVIKKPLDRGG